jgi:hypothetical protein
LLSIPTAEPASENRLLPASLVHHIGDSFEQMGTGKGLLKIMVTWTESPSGMVDGKAANQNDLCCGPKKMCASGNIKTIKHRTEVDISDYHAWRTDRIGQTESFVWIGGGDNFESSVTEHVLDSLPDEIIIVHKQNLEAQRFSLFTGHWQKDLALSLSNVQETIQVYRRFRYTISAT